MDPVDPINTTEYTCIACGGWQHAADIEMLPYLYIFLLILSLDLSY